MTRILIAATLGVLSLASTAVAQDNYTWVETRFHRVHLRNGNFIDGKVVGLTEREVLVKLLPGDMNIRRDTIDRIELIKMRSLLEKPKLDPPLKKVEPKAIANAPSTPSTEPIIPVPEVPDALKSNVSAILGRMRIATPDQKEDLIADLSRLPNAAPYLASQMGTVNDDTVEYVGNALRKMKDLEALPYIAAHLESRRELVVIESAKLIGDHEDVSWARFVRPLLGHAQPAIRSTAVSALSRVGDRESLPAILDLLNESERAVRSGAIVASINLGKKFGEVNMVAAQFRLSLRGATREALPDLLSGVGKLQKAELWDAVVPYVRDNDEEVRGAAVDALGALGSKDSAEAILAQMRMESDKKVRLRMMKCATAIKSLQFVDQLVDWLRDQDDDIVKAANKSLEDITAKRFGPDHGRWSTWWEQTKSR